MLPNIYSTANIGIAPNLRNIIQPPNKMFGLLLYNADCRISEGLSVKVKDMDFATVAGSRLNVDFRS
jgi:hypothetical protein